MVDVPTGESTGCLESLPPLSSQSVQSQEKSPVSHRVRRETQSMNLAPGANPEGKEIVKGKAGEITSSRIGSYVYVCVYVFCVCVCLCVCMCVCIY